MKRRIGILLSAATLIGAVAVLVPVQSASAATCVGQARTTLDKGIGYAVVSKTLNVGFNTGTATSVCSNGAVNPPTQASGTLAEAACGLSHGSGTINGRGFNLQTAGTLLVFSPAGGSSIRGVGNAVTDPTVPNNSCGSHTAFTFIVTSAIDGAA